MHPITGDDIELVPGKLYVAMVDIYGWIDEHGGVWINAHVLTGATMMFVDTCKDDSTELKFLCNESIVHVSLTAFAREGAIGEYAV